MDTLIDSQCHARRGPCDTLSLVYLDFSSSMAGTRGPVIHFLMTIAQ